MTNRDGSASVSLNRTLWLVPASPLRMRRRRRVSWSGQSESYKWSGDGLTSPRVPSNPISSWPRNTGSCRWTLEGFRYTPSGQFLKAFKTIRLVYFVKYTVTFEFSNKTKGIKVKCFHLILSGRNNRIDETFERRIGIKTSWWWRGPDRFHTSLAMCWRSSVTQRDWSGLL